jgi:hypothetical protein
MSYNLPVLRNEYKITQLRNHIKEIRNVNLLQEELVPNFVTEETLFITKVNETNPIQKKILENHYSCLEYGSLVQDQLKPRPKNLSGSQRITQVGSKAYKGLQVHSGKKELIVIEESKSKGQSSLMQYAESLKVYEDSLEKDQLELRHKPSGSQLIGRNLELEVEEKVLPYECYGDQMKSEMEPIEETHLNLYQRIKKRVMESIRKLCNFVWKRRPSMFPPVPEAEGKISGIIYS